MKKKPYNLAIIIGFLTLYLCAMILATYIATNNFKDKHKNNVNQVVNDMNSALYYHDAIPVEPEHRSAYLTSLITQSEVFRPTENDYQHIAIALYSSADGKLAQTDANFQIILRSGMQDEKTTYFYTTTELFTTADQNRLAKYYAEHFKQDAYWDVYISPDEQSHIPLTVDIFAMCKSKTSAQYKNASTSFSWVKPNTDIEQITYTIGSMNKPYDLVVPYASLGYDAYLDWRDDIFIHDFPDKNNVSENKQNGTLFKQENVYIGRTIYPAYYYVIRETARPLIGALDSLKFVYLIALLFTIICIVVILRITNKTYAKRVALEETRRDFTNAIAHELKTPLGVIRGFAENLQEDTSYDKRDYYLKQVINQTENMDDMVKEMLYISKLDSEQLKFKKETIFVTDMIKEQLKKLENLVDEKNLFITYESSGDFIVEADKQYLEKAIWNLLSNAIDYNRLDGSITVTTSATSCTIENTGTPIAPEDMEHIFEMFYTSNKSRSAKAKHLGIGLYLAKRILEMHNLKLSIENVEDGVKITIAK